MSAPTSWAAASSASSRGSCIASATGRTSSTRHPVDLADLDHEQVDQLVVGQLDHELVDRLAAVALEDVDPHDVAADGTDPACHLAQRPGAIGQPHAQDEGRHGDGTYARVVNASFRAHNRNVSALRDGPPAARHARAAGRDVAGSAPSDRGSVCRPSDARPVREMSVRSAHARQCPLTQPS